MKNTTRTEAPKDICSIAEFTKIYFPKSYSSRSKKGEKDRNFSTGTGLATELLNNVKAKVK